MVVIFALALLGIARSLACDYTIEDLSEVPSVLQDLSETTADDIDVHICFHTGRTYHATTLHLDGGLHNHPGGGRVVWRPTTSGGRGTPPTLSGGASLTNWLRCNDGIHCPWPEWNGVWVHFTTGLNITADFLPPRNLWVNGSRASRVVVDGSTLGWSVTTTGFAAPSAAPQSLVDDQVELRWPRVIKNWIEPRCTIAAVSGNNITVEPACWTALTARNGGKLPPVPTFVENVVAPPGPGEFTATKDYIFWRPPASDPFAAPADAWIPSQEQILVATGLVNHTFSGLRFQHGTWRVPTKEGGFVPSQTLVTPTAGEPLGAVQLDAAVGVEIEDCAFANIGAAYALSVGKASRNVRVSGNSFRDLSGGALKIGNIDCPRCVSTDPADFDIDYEVVGNVMESVAVEYHGGAALFAGYVARTTIDRNTIRNTGYTGISLGWGWGTHVSGPQTFAADNHITRNRLEGVMSALNDGGCTYTLGPQPGSTVMGNYCSSDAAPVDNGSRYFTTTNNVCTTTPAPCVYLQGCCNAPAYDIAVSNLWCRDTAPVRNGCAAENCTIDEGSVFVLGANAPWPPKAQAIVDASGASNV